MMGNPYYLKPLERFVVANPNDDEARRIAGNHELHESFYRLVDAWMASKCGGDNQWSNIDGDRMDELFKHAGVRLERAKKLAEMVAEERINED